MTSACSSFFMIKMKISSEVVIHILEISFVLRKVMFCCLVVSVVLECPPLGGFGLCRRCTFSISFIELI